MYPARYRVEITPHANHLHSLIKRTFPGGSLAEECQRKRAKNECCIFEVKTIMGIELDWPVTLGSVTLVRVKSVGVTAVWIGDRYMRQMKLFMRMTENSFIDWYTLHCQK